MDAAERAMSNFGQGQAGQFAGEQFRHNFRQFLQGLDLKQNVEDLFNEINKGFDAGIDGLKAGDKVKKGTDEFQDGMKEIRRAFSQELDFIRGDIQRLFSNGARDWALTFMPWIAAGAGILVGTPLAVHYLYKKALHNLGKPKLASENRQVGLYNRTVNLIKGGTSGLIESIKPALFWGTVVGVGGFLGSLGVATAFAVQGDRVNAQAWGQIAEGTLCQLFGPPDRRYSDCDSTGFGTLAGAVALAAGTTFAYNIASRCWSVMKDVVKIRPKPIFSPEITRRIDDIIDATYNINKHGGYFQNLLLYGPGGTGKTMIAEKIAEDSGMNYIKMSGGDLAQYIKRGEHVSELNRLFESVHKAAGPTIIFIDEAEGLCRDRDQMKDAERIELLNAWLNHTGTQSKKFMLVLATNSLEIDEAALTRMDHKIFVGPPAEPERKKIIDLYLPMFFGGSERKEFFPDYVVDAIAKATGGLTGRALFKMINTLYTSKSASKNNKVNNEIIEHVVTQFVRQEEEMRLRQKAKQEGTVFIAPTYSGSGFVIPVPGQANTELEVEAVIVEDQAPKLEDSKQLQFTRIDDVDVEPTLQVFLDDTVCLPEEQCSESETELLADMV
jgi:hypothetical protein